MNPILVEESYNIPVGMLPESSESANDPIRVLEES